VAARLREKRFRLRYASADKSAGELATPFCLNCLPELWLKMAQSTICVIRKATPISRASPDWPT